MSVRALTYERKTLSLNMSGDCGRARDLLGVVWVSAVGVVSAVLGVAHSPCSKEWRTAGDGSLLRPRNTRIEI